MAFGLSRSWRMNERGWWKVVGWKDNPMMLVTDVISILEVFLSRTRWYRLRMLDTW